MAYNTQFYQEILKERYAPAIYNQIPQGRVLLADLEKSSEFVDISGKRFVVPLQMGHAQGVGVTSERGYFPKASPPKYAVATYAAKLMTGTIDISDTEMAVSASKLAAFEPILTANMNSLVENFRFELNRQFFGDGSGILATCGAMSAAGNTIPVSSTKYLFVNMIIDIVNKNTGAVLAQGRKVTAVVPNTSITIDGTAVQTTADHVIVRSNVYENAFMNECNGLALIVDTTKPLGDVDPTQPGNENWAAIVIDKGANTPVDVALLEEARDRIEENGGKVDYILTTRGVRRAIVKYLEAEKRIHVEGNTVKLPGGVSALLWDGLPVAVDRDCQPGTMYFIDHDALQIGQLDKPHWREFDNGEILQPDPNRPVWYAQYIWHLNLICLYRNRLAKIVNIAEA